jgi:GTP-binding protein EngB required for normal cell division
MRADLPEVVAALHTIAELGPGRLSPDQLRATAALRARIDERLAIGDAVTVAALAGGTGVGKSALVNRIAGASVVDEGVRRPTTGQPVAVASSYDGPTLALLDWLSIADRRTAPALPAGLVLVDLPDHDSVVTGHRETAGRLAARVDAVVVVVDPVKYARADLHEGPLAALTAQTDTVLVVLNHADALSDQDRTRCLADLAERLAAGGHPHRPVYATSARTGAGIDALRDTLTDLAERRTAAVVRLLGDAALLGADLDGTLATLPERHLDVEVLVAPVLEATDAHRRVGDAEVTYRRDARHGSRSPLARAVRVPLGVAAGMLTDLGLQRARPRPTGHRPDPERIAAVLAAELGLAATTGVAHTVLADRVAGTARDAAGALAATVASVAPSPDRRRWWAALAWARGVSEAVAAVGFAWLLLLGVLRWFGLPEPPTATVTDALSWPAALALGGLAVRVLLGLVTRVATRVGARRHRAEVARRLRTELAATLDRTVVAPFEAERDRDRRLSVAVAALTQPVAS